jgi:hypothetical protein
MTSATHLIIGSVFSILGGAVFFHGFNRMHKFQLIENTPTSKIRSMAVGIVEVNGDAVNTKYLKTPFSNEDCVYYKYEIKEYRQHTSRDSKGRTHTYYSWDTIATGEQRAPFFVRDETGQAYVEPTDAEVNITVKKVFYQKCGIFGAFGTILSALKNFDSAKPGKLNANGWGLTLLENGDSGLTFSSVGDRKYYEYFIAPKEKIYIIGTAATARNGVFIKKGENEKTFIISTRSERELVKNLKWQMVLGFAAGGVFIIAGIFLLINGFNIGG